MPTTEPRLVVAAAVVDDLGSPRRLLAARRTRPPALAGHWELPGGKVEPGEEPVAALRRELAEELGVAVEMGAELTPPSGGLWPVTAGFAMRVWWCTVVAGRPTITAGHDALRWVDADDIDELRWLPGDRAIVGQLSSVLTAHQRG